MSTFFNTYYAFSIISALYMLEIGFIYVLHTFIHVYTSL